MSRPRHMARRRDMFSEPIYRATHRYPVRTSAHTVLTYEPKHRRNDDVLLINLLRSVRSIRSDVRVFGLAGTPKPGLGKAGFADVFMGARL